MIQLGLQRAAQLFRNNPQPWKAVHVAGTNGKGTVCAYLSALLHATGVPCGRFTSPHLIDRWDCISINEKPVDKKLFHEVEAQMLELNKTEDIKATEFELLTATAFEIFTREKVQVGIVEVGMGGRDDATNILKSKAVTVITKIGLDHQAFLGHTVEEIAKHKCGIFEKDVPVVYNYTNDEPVIDVIKAEAKAVGAGPLLCPKLIPRFKFPKWKQFAQKLRTRKQQRLGIASAFATFKILQPMFPNLKPNNTTHFYERTIIGTSIPGRLQNINIKPFIGVDKHALLDGAHNAQAADNLGLIVASELRQYGLGPVTWVVANTKGKDLPGFLTPLIRACDSVAIVEFGPVDGMPWIEPAPSEDILKAVRELHPDIPAQPFGHDLKSALTWATQDKRGDHPVVIAGSLYLVSDVLRSARDDTNTDS